jgi:hypothetical protein
LPVVFPSTVRSDVVRDTFKVQLLHDGLRNQKCGEISEMVRQTRQAIITISRTLVLTRLRSSCNPSKRNDPNS